jgi:hypothetical protein
MRLYYYPVLFRTTEIDFPLYTEECVALMDEASREDLRELDAETIRKIGNRPCQFQQPRPREEAKRATEQASSRLQEWRL